MARPRFVADVNFHGHIVRGLLLRDTTIDIIRAQDAGLDTTEDPDLLAWAAREGRILLTHDVRTVTKFARECLERGEPMAGVIEVPDYLAVGVAIDELLLIVGASEASDWENRISFLPL